MAFFGDLIELSCHMNTDAWARLSDSTYKRLINLRFKLGILIGAITLTPVASYNRWQSREGFVIYIKKYKFAFENVGRTMSIDVKLLGWI